MIFGRKPAMFGQQFDPLSNGPFGTPGIGDGMNERQMGPPGMGMAPEPKKQAFFGQGGPGRAILGTIGDVLLQRGGNAPIYGPTIQQQNRLMQQQQMAEQQRMQEREDFIWKQQNQKSAPYRFESNDGSQIEIGPDGQPKVLYKDPTPKINWIQVKDPVTGAIQIVPMGPNGPLNQSAPPAFAGWADEEGGQTASPSGNFRPR
jgi:hypothetical protein